MSKIFLRHFNLQLEVAIFCLPMTQQFLLITCDFSFDTLYTICKIFEGKLNNDSASLIEFILTIKCNSPIFPIEFTFVKIER